MKNYGFNLAMRAKKLKLQRENSSLFKYKLDNKETPS
jgi:hypothetical protein